MRQRLATFLLMASFGPRRCSVSVSRSNQPPLPSIEGTQRSFTVEPGLVPLK